MLGNRGEERRIIIINVHYRADEEAAGRAKAEKEKRDLATQLQETQDDLDSEREARNKSEKTKRQLNNELEKLQELLDDTTSSTTAQQAMTAQRESELSALKRTLEEEIAGHEAAVSSMRQKHSRTVEDLNEQLENAKKVNRHVHNIICFSLSSHLLFFLSSSSLFFSLLGQEYAW